MGSRIKALTVAGLTPEEIAKRLHTCVENIETFLKLYFDVADYLTDHSALGAIFLPRLEQTSAINPREQVWLLAAYKLGIRGFEYVAEQRVKLTKEEQREISDAIHCILAEQSLRYSFSLQSKPEAGPEVMAAYQKSLETRLRNPPTEDDSRMKIFTDNVMRIAAEKFAPQIAAAKAGRSPQAGTSS
jgi:hypothetical protein